MGDFSELWIQVDGSYSQVVGEQEQRVEWQYPIFDAESSVELFGELATAALENYFQAEPTGVNLVTRTGFPPDVVYAAMAQAKEAAVEFSALTQIPIDQVIASRPHAESKVIIP
jgi:hypothetical protein